MHQCQFSFAAIRNRIVTLAKLPAYNPDDENHYDFHLTLCILADTSNKGAINRFELTKVHSYFNAAYDLWHLNNKCPSLTD